MLTHRHIECDSNGRHGHKSARPVSRSHRKTGIKRLFAMAVLLVFICFEFAAQASTQSVEESRVKAAYLYNFAKFVEWPPGVFHNPDDPAVICVVGDERTSDVLEPAIAGKKANGRPVEARRPHSSVELKSCQVLFIGFSDKERIAQLLKEVQQLSVLTVGQSDHFIPLGGMINLAFKDTTIALEIDPEPSTAVGLKISSRLLVVAQLVKGRRQTGGER